MENNKTVKSFMRVYLIMYLKLGSFAAVNQWHDWLVLKKYALSLLNQRRIKVGDCESFKRLNTLSDYVHSSIYHRVEGRKDYKLTTREFVQRIYEDAYNKCSAYCEQTGLIINSEDAFFCDPDLYSFLNCFSSIQWVTNHWQANYGDAIRGYIKRIGGLYEKY